MAEFLHERRDSPLSLLEAEQNLIKEHRLSLAAGGFPEKALAFRLKQRR